MRATTSSRRWTESGVIDKTALVFGQMDEPPGTRLRVALSGLTMAEYFRDVQKQDVLFFIDNIFRFTQAGSEVSTLLGRMPSAVGYQPNLADEMGLLQERITSTRGHSITSMQAIYVPADDLTDPAPATTFAHLDATTVLSRPISEKGIYPAVDPLDSTSRILDPRYIARTTTTRAMRVKTVLQKYKDLQDIIAILGIDELGEGVEDVAQRGVADRHRDRAAGVGHLGTADQAVGGLQRDGADHAVADVLGHLERERRAPRRASVELGLQHVVHLRHRVGGNSTSTTGPMTRAIRPCRRVRSSGRSR